MEYYNRHEIYFIVVLSLHAIHKNSPCSSGRSWRRRKRGNIGEEKWQKFIKLHSRGSSKLFHSHILSCAYAQFCIYCICYVRLWKFEVNCRLRGKMSSFAAVADDLKNLKLLLNIQKILITRRMNQSYIFISKTIWYSLRAHSDTHTHNLWTSKIHFWSNFNPFWIEKHTSILLNVTTVNYFYDFLQSFSGFHKWKFCFHSLLLLLLWVFSHTHA